MLLGRSFQARSTCATRCAGGSSTARCTCTATSAAAARSSPQRAPGAGARRTRAASTSGPPSTPRCSHEDRLIVARVPGRADRARAPRVLAWAPRACATGRSRRSSASASTRRAKPPARASESASASSCSTTPGGCAAIAPRRSSRCRPARRRASELAQRAFAHLQACASCRAEHKTNARRLRAKLPGPGRRAAARSRCSPGSSAGSRGSSCARARSPHGCRHGRPRRERRPCANARWRCSRAAARARSSPPGSRPSRCIAGGTIGATRALKPPVSHPHAAARRARERTAPAAARRARPARRRARRRPAAAAAPPRQRADRRSHSQRHGAPEQREPGGFAYLGVPSASPPRAGAQARASSASVSGASRSSGEQPARANGSAEAGRSAHEHRDSLAAPRGASRSSHHATPRGDRRGKETTARMPTPENPTHAGLNAAPGRHARGSVARACATLAATFALALLASAQRARRRMGAGLLRQPRTRAPPAAPAGRASPPAAATGRTTAPAAGRAARAFAMLSTDAAVARRGSTRRCSTRRPPARRSPAGCSTSACTPTGTATTPPAPRSPTPPNTPTTARTSSSSAPPG